MIRRPEALPYRHVLTLPTTGAAVRVARETTEQVLTEWGVDRRHPCVDPVLLILAELVTNSVRHAAAVSPQVTVVYAGGPDTFAFAVHDRHPFQPALLAAFTDGGRGGEGGGGRGDGAGAASGGGLPTVVQLTLQLGGTAVVRADPDGRGKSVWITLPL
ncbi:MULTISPECIES: ATP-binding protein [unclassified Streptomyces]|uniref:ATP-binding protein n=1 Tax=unclassified Streptomyces TaxID=2593676 RepID=UPI003829FC48